MKLSRFASYRATRYCYLIPSHCEADWLCSYCRPCSCRCVKCIRFPMTDNRPATSGRG